MNGSRQRCEGLARCWFALRLARRIPDTVWLVTFGPFGAHIRLREEARRG